MNAVLVSIRDFFQKYFEIFQTFDYVTGIHQHYLIIIISRI